MGPARQDAGELSIPLGSSRWGGEEGGTVPLRQPGGPPRHRAVKEA
jgi:hypothetical protein